MKLYASDRCDNAELTLNHSALLNEIITNFLYLNENVVFII